MRNILLFIFIFFNFSLYVYNEDEIICIATYELATDFFASMKDEKTSQEMFLKNKNYWINTRMVIFH